MQFCVTEALTVNNNSCQSLQTSINMQRIDSVEPWFLQRRQKPGLPTHVGLGVSGIAIGQVRPIIAKRTVHNFSAKRKRPKDYSSDSSASEKETDGKTEGRIYRAPPGSGKDYFVYYKGRKISFGDSSMKNKNNDDGARANFMARHNCAGEARKHCS